MTGEVGNKNSNPFCKCEECTCKPICTCGLDDQSPVSVEGAWDDQEQVMTYVVKLKPKK